MKVLMQIIDAGQHVSLDGENAGEVRNSFTVRLSNGRTIPISTSEETVNRLIELLTEVSRVQQAASLETADTHQVISETAMQPMIGQIAEPPLKPSAIPGLGQGVALDSKGYPVRGRNRAVEADEFGYPIVPSSADRDSQAQIEDEDDPGEQI